MQIALDSSTLILLAKTELLDILLDECQGKIFISRTVQQECLIKHSPDARLIQRRIMEGKIKVKHVRDYKLCEKIKRDFNLNRGGAETIIMAGQFKVVLATDDWNAIQCCKILKLPFTSTLAILIRLKEKKILATETAISKLETLAEYGRYDEQISRHVRKRLEG